MLFRLSVLPIAAPLTLITSLATPYFYFSGLPLHLSVLFLVISAILMVAKSGITFGWLFLIIAPLCLPLLADLLGGLLYGHQMAYNTLWAGVPLSLFFTAFWVFYNMDIDWIYVFRIVFVLSAMMIAFSIFHFSFLGQEILHAVGFIPDHRLDVLSRYLMLVAPIGNPNNNALIAALLAIGVSISIGRLSLSGFGLAFLSLLFLSLCLVVYFGYARTVMVGFVLAFIAVVIMLISDSEIQKKKRLLISIVGVSAVLSLALTLFLSQGRGAVYFGTVLHAGSDASFLARFEFWRSLSGWLMDFPLYLFIGAGWYRVEAVGWHGGGVVDSSYWFLVLQFGLIVTAMIIVFGVRLLLRAPQMLPWLILLAVSAVNLAFISDLRLAILVGGILGLVYTAELGRYGRRGKPRS